MKICLIYIVFAIHVQSFSSFITPIHVQSFSSFITQVYAYSNYLSREKKNTYSPSCNLCGIIKLKDFQRG